MGSTGLWCFLFLCAMCVFPATGAMRIMEKGSSIQKEIARASAYDTILIPEGFYKENNIEIRKPLTLRGVGRPVIDGEGKGDLLVISSDSVTIQGLQLQNTGISYLKEHAAIRLIRTGYVRLLNNKIRNSFFGIYLQYSRDCIIENNSIIGNTTEDSRAGNAIHIWKGNRIKVLNNVTGTHRDGIYFEFVDSSLIEGNKSFNNIRYGLHFMFSNNDTYAGNHFHHNGSGVAVMFSKNIKMIRNKFEHNQGGASYGILLKEISGGEMRGNLFNENTVGIYAEGATAIRIVHNDFKSNGKAIDMKGNSLDNVIMNNNFYTNTFEVYTNTRSNLNRYDYNYWSQYRGFDLNKDGIGDEYYRPVNLMSIITGHVPAAYLLLHSFLSSFLDLMEKIFPQMIPETLIDNHPLMKPNIHPEIL